MKAVDRFCELCNARAALYCPSDSAFLCWSCDAQVHRANFLVARHLRRVICSECKGFAVNPVSALCFPPSTFFCDSCSPASTDEGRLDSLSSSSNSDCVSSTTSCAISQKKTDSDRRRILNCPNDLAGGVEVKSNQRISSRDPSILDLKSEGVLVYWCGKLGLPGDRAVRLARSALNLCWERMSLYPFRVGLAACLWFGLRFCGDGSLRTRQVLKRVEDISGVQAKLISAAESKLERVIRVIASTKRRRRRSLQLDEGWAESECSA